MSDFELVGAKLFPERHERDKVISQFLKGKNRTELVKEALYRLAMSSTTSQAPASQDTADVVILQKILGQLEKLNTSGVPVHTSPSPNTFGDTQPTREKEFIPDLSLPSLESLEVVDKSPGSSSSPTNMKQMQKSLLKGFKDFKT